LSTTIPRSSGWTLWSNNGNAVQVEKNHPRVSGCSVPDVVKQKLLLSSCGFSIFPWIKNTTVYKEKNRNETLAIKCRAILPSDLGS